MRRFGFGRRCFGGGCAGARQADDEFAAVAQAFAFGGDMAVVHLDQVLHQGQADAQPAMGAFERVVDLGKHVEDAPQHIRANANALVPDVDVDGVGQNVDAEVDLAAFG